MAAYVWGVPTADNTEDGIVVHYGYAIGVRLGGVFYPLESVGLIGNLKIKIQSKKNIKEFCLKRLVGNWIVNDVVHDVIYIVTH